MARRTRDKAWTPEADDELRALYAARMPQTEIAKALGRTATSVSIRAARLGLAGDGLSKRLWTDDESRDASALPWHEFRTRHPDRTFMAYRVARQRFREALAVPQVDLVDYRTLVRSVEGDVAIAACVHCPQTDPEMWARFCAVVERDRIPTAILAGDVCVGDMFSRWDVRETWQWEAELESIRLHLRALLQVAERVVVLPGNHVGNRIVRLSGGHIRLRQIIDMAGLADAERERIDTTDLDYLELDSGEERFLVAHSANYSKIGGRVPVWYAEKYQRHVIAGNGHQVGWQVSPSGRYHGIDLGTMANPAYMGYAQRALSTFPVMMQSFVTVRNGAIRVYGAGKPLTDWPTELAS